MCGYGQVLHNKDLWCGRSTDFSVSLSVWVAMCKQWSNIISLIKVVQCVSIIIMILVFHYVCRHVSTMRNIAMQLHIP